MTDTNDPGSGTTTDATVLEDTAEGAILEDVGLAEGLVGESVPSGKKPARQSSPWLVWRAFRRHRLAMIGLFFTLLIYLIALFAEFLAPYSTSAFNPDYTYAPPQALHVVQPDGSIGLYVHGYAMVRDPESLAVTYTPDPDSVIDVHLFGKGEPYKMWGLIPMDRHLFTTQGIDHPMYLLGADRAGKDLLSGLIYGTRVSMSIGLIGVAMAFVLGVVLGGISGYIGGRTDTLLQRLVEFFMSLPTLPLWLGLAAALPATWGPLNRYFAITLILGLVAWTGLARTTRGWFLSLRREEYVTSARLDGNRTARVIFRHILPSFTSYLIASLTLSIPGMILAETSLSFLGLGLQAPIVSWGVLLEQAQNVRVVASAPWLMIPGLAVVIAVLSLNFVGDGLRDAADPYRQ